MTDKINSNMTEKINIYKLKKEECSRKQKQTLTSLTYRKDSGMRQAWNSIDNDKYADKYEFYIKNHLIHIAYLENKIVGWALSYTEKNQIKPRAMFYVSKAFRRKGIGTKLLNSIREDYNTDPFVFWSENSKFFLKNGLNSKKII